MFEIGKTFRFEAAHRLHHHDGKCSREHGHSYEFELIVESADLQLEGAKAGMVVDYDQVTAVGKWIEDQFDHRHLNEVLDSDTTTAEELSRLVWQMASAKLPNLVEMRFKETAKTWASYRPRRAEERRAQEIARAMIAEVRERLYDGIDTSDPKACWLFSRSKDSMGYGYFECRLVKTNKAHRVSAWLAGDDIEHKVVMHLCDQPSCVNPEHLYTGTHAENEADKDDKKRRPIGEAHGAAKLKNDNVLDIVSRIEAGETHRAVADRYKVSTSLTKAILSGRVWRHITKRPRT